MYEYLVRCSGKKKIVTAEDKNCLHEIIKKTFKIENDIEMTIQQWDTEWEDFIDVDNLNDLRDKGKLSVVCSYNISTTVDSIQIPDISISPPR
jgi:hypothetical protein